MGTGDLPRNIEVHFRRLEHMYSSAPINDYFAPVLHVSEGRVEVMITVRPDFFHAAHALHGSVYFKALDDAAFFATNSVVRDVFVLTVNFNVVLLRSVRNGVITASGRTRAQLPESPDGRGGADRRASKTAGSRQRHIHAQ